MSSHPVDSLSAFLDDELEDAQRRDVAAHVAACPSCARQLREMAAVDALARGLPPAGAPDGYLEALPGRVRRRIRADRPLSARAPWVWPLAAGLALAVLAPLLLRQSPAPESRSAGRPAVVMEEPAVPTTTAAPETRETPAYSADTVTLLPASPPAPRREARVAKVRDEFAPPPPAAIPTPESDRGAERVSGGLLGGVVGGVDDARPAAAPPAEQEALAAAGRRTQERAESASSLKRADAPRQNAAAPKRVEDPEKSFLDNAALPASTPEEARAAREAWRRFVSLHPAGPRADEALVRFIEAAVAAFRLTREEGDRAIAEREARAYLATPGAPQASRVRAALRRLER